MVCLILFHSADVFSKINAFILIIITVTHCEIAKLAIKMKGIIYVQTHKK